MRRIDNKHHVDGDKIIKTTNGQEIPIEEPTILFRGRDWLALPLLQEYRRLCIQDGCNDHQMESLDEMINEFKKFQEEQPKKMKQPGVTRGL